MAQDKKSASRRLRELTKQVERDIILGRECATPSRRTRSFVPVEQLPTQSLTFNVDQTWTSESASEETTTDDDDALDVVEETFDEEEDDDYYTGTVTAVNREVKKSSKKRKIDQVDSQSLEPVAKKQKKFTVEVEVWKPPEPAIVADKTVFSGIYFLLSSVYSEETRRMIVNRIEQGDGRVLGSADMFRLMQADGQRVVNIAQSKFAFVHSNETESHSKEYLISLALNIRFVTIEWLDLSYSSGYLQQLADEKSDTVDLKPNLRNRVLQSTSMRFAICSSNIEFQTFYSDFLKLAGSKVVGVDSKDAFESNTIVVAESQENLDRDCLTLVRSKNLPLVSTEYVVACLKRRELMQPTEYLILEEQKEQFQKRETEMKRIVKKRCPDSALKRKHLNTPAKTSRISAAPIPATPQRTVDQTMKKLAKTSWVNKSNPEEGVFVLDNQTSMLTKYLLKDTVQLRQPSGRIVMIKSFFELQGAKKFNALAFTPFEELSETIKQQIQKDHNEERKQRRMNTLFLNVVSVEEYFVYEIQSHVRVVKSTIPNSFICDKLISMSTVDETVDIVNHKMVPWFNPLLPNVAPSNEAGIKAIRDIKQKQERKTNSIVPLDDPKVQTVNATTTDSHNNFLISGSQFSSGDFVRVKYDNKVIYGKVRNLAIHKMKTRPPKIQCYLNIRMLEQRSEAGPLHLVKPRPKVLTSLNLKLVKEIEQILRSTREEINEENQSFFFYL